MGLETRIRRLERHQGQSEPAAAICYPAGLDGPAYVIPQSGGVRPAGDVQPGPATKVYIGIDPERV